MGAGVAGASTSAKTVLSRIGRIDDHLDRHFKATLAAQNLSFYAFKLLATLRRTGPPYRLTPTEALAHPPRRLRR